MIISYISKTISRATPTGKLYEFFKRRRERKCESENIKFDPFDVSWKFDQICLLLSFIFVIYQFLSELLHFNESWVYFWVYVCLLLIQISRSVEIPFGFFADLIDKVVKEPHEQQPGTAKRMGLAILVYFETALNYSLIYNFFPKEQWSLKKSLTIIDSLYFSVVTISTVGYGDIAPNGVLSKVATISEIITSLIIIALSFTIYSGSKK